MHQFANSSIRQFRNPVRQFANSFGFAFDIPLSPLHAPHFTAAFHCFGEAETIVMGHVELGEGNAKCETK